MNQENYNASSKTYNQPIKKKKNYSTIPEFSVASCHPNFKKKKEKNNKFTSTLKKSKSSIRKKQYI